MYLCCVIKYYQHINCSSLKEYGYKSEKNRNQKIKASCWICNCLWNIGHHLQPAMNPSLWRWHAPSLVRWTIDVPRVWRTPCSRPRCFRWLRLLRDFLLSSGSEVNGWFCCSLVALQHQSIVRLHLLTLHHHSMMTSSITKTPTSSSLPAVDPFTNAGITHAKLHPRSHEMLLMQFWKKLQLQNKTTLMRGTMNHIFSSRKLLLCIAYSSLFGTPTCLWQWNHNSSKITEDFNIANRRKILPAHSNVVSRD